MPNSESSVGVHSRFVFPILLNPEPYFPFVFIRGYPALLAPFLDQLDFVALRRVDKSDDATEAGFGWAVGEGITFGFSLFGNVSISSISNAKWVRSGPTWTGPVSLNSQSSSSASLPGSLRNTSFEPREEV
jgi:hypothetical protein